MWKYWIKNYVRFNYYLQGKFKWVFRTRIRVTFSGHNSNQIPIELHEQALRYKLTDLVDDERRRTCGIDGEKFKRVLPVLALNEASCKSYKQFMRLLGSKRIIIFKGVSR